MYVYVNYVPPFEEEIKKALGDQFGQYHEEVKNGFAEGLLTPRAQLIAIFDREGVYYVDVAFEISVWAKEFMVMVYAYQFDAPADVPQTIFRLNTLNSIMVPFDFSVMLKYKNSVVGSFTRSLEAGRRLASDLARKGIPRDVNNNIAEIAKVLRKGTKFSGLFSSGSQNWIRVE